eukprot:TRINITY_DN4619_c0_g1_i1.p1 TRINITY_DN4619_c0_g1~~TRINITY_DN4619_c0_g1_i1.p1  ORF type:complete len:365 (-),score=107.87 TRINITY_DN4619_c0_g1_i1:125-1219(-)
MNEKELYEYFEFFESTKIIENEKIDGSCQMKIVPIVYFYCCLHKYTKTANLLQRKYYEILDVEWFNSIEFRKECEVLLINCEKDRLIKKINDKFSIFFQKNKDMLFWIEILSFYERLRIGKLENFINESHYQIRNDFSKYFKDYVDDYHVELVQTCEMFIVKDLPEIFDESVANYSISPKLMFIFSKLKNLKKQLDFYLLMSYLNFNELKDSPKFFNIDPILQLLKDSMFIQCFYDIQNATDKNQQPSYMDDDSGPDTIFMSQENEDIHYDNVLEQLNDDFFLLPPLNTNPDINELPQSLTRPTTPLDIVNVNQLRQMVLNEVEPPFVSQTIPQTNVRSQLIVTIDVGDFNRLINDITSNSNNE